MSARKARFLLLINVLPLKIGLLLRSMNFRLSLSGRVAFGVRRVISILASPAAVQTQPDVILYGDYCNAALDLTKHLKTQSRFHGAPLHTSVKVNKCWP